MRKNIKKCISILLSSILMLSFGMTIHAESPAESSVSLSSEQKAIVEILKSDTTQAEKELLFKKTLAQKNGEQLESKISTAQTVTIDKNTSVKFNSDGTFSVTTLQTSPSKSTIVKPLVQTIDYTNTVKAYGLIGNLLYRIDVTGYFTGEIGSTPTGNLVEAYYTKGPLSIWQVSNWEKGTSRNTGTKKATVYGKGNFHYGFEYDGNGLVIQDTYENVQLVCDKNFNISKVS